MDRLPDEIGRAIWGCTWVQLDATIALRARYPHVLQLRWWPYWNLLRNTAMKLALWGAAPRCAVRNLALRLPLWLHRPLCFPQLPAPPPFSQVRQDDVIACVVPQHCLWIGTVRHRRKNTSPSLGRWGRLDCSGFAVIYLDGEVFCGRRRTMRRVLSWCVL